MQQHFVPCITTERLLIRQLQPADDDAIFALRSNEQVNVFIQRPLSKNLDDAREFIRAINNGIENKEWQFWAMVLQNTQQLIGTICLWHFSQDDTMAEIGYELHPQYQGFGLMQEAIQSIIEYGFITLQLEIIEAFTQPENEKSIKLLEKSGFIQDKASCNSDIGREVRFVLYKSLYTPAKNNKVLNN